MATNHRGWQMSQFCTSPNWKGDIFISSCFIEKQILQGDGNNIPKYWGYVMIQPAVISMILFLSDIIMIWAIWVIMGHDVRNQPIIFKPIGSMYGKKHAYICFFWWYMLPYMAEKWLYDYVEVSINGGTPVHHPFLDGIFPHKHHPYLKVMETTIPAPPEMRMAAAKVWPSSPTVAPGTVGTGSVPSNSPLRAS